MEESNASYRSQIGKVYDNAVVRLGGTKTAFKAMVARKLYEERQEKKLAKMDGDDKDALKKFSQALGDTPFGQWAGAAADKIPESGD